MKLALIGAIAALGVSACADGYRGGPGPGPGPLAYDAYYDDFYGPFDDGYWGPDGGFYYSTGPDHHFVRDQGNHFSHSAIGGMHGVHFHGGGHGGGGGPHGGHG